MNIITEEKFTPYKNIPEKERPDIFIDIVDYPNLFGNKIADRLLNTLDNLPRKTIVVKQFGREVEEPSPILFFSDNPAFIFKHKHNSIGEIPSDPFPHDINCIRNGIQNLTGLKYNSCIVEVHDEGKYNHFSLHLNTLSRDIAIAFFAREEYPMTQFIADVKNSLGDVLKEKHKLESGELLVLRRTVPKHWDFNVHKIGYDKQYSLIFLNVEETSQCIHIKQPSPIPSPIPSPKLVLSFDSLVEMYKTYRIEQKRAVRGYGDMPVLLTHDIPDDVVYIVNSSIDKVLKDIPPSNEIRVIDIQNIEYNIGLFLDRRRKEEREMVKKEEEMIRQEEQQRIREEDDRMKK